MDPNWVQQHLANIVQSFNNRDLLIQWAKSIGQQNHPDVLSRLYGIYLQDKVLTFSDTTQLLNYSIPLNVVSHPIVLQRLKTLHNNYMDTENVSIIIQIISKYTFILSFK